MADAEKAGRPSQSSESDRSSIDLPVNPEFSGYRPFPPVMHLYSDFSGVFKALKTQKLCGATENDFLYLVEVHFGYTPRGPLHFGHGFYLRNGTTMKAPILAGVGDEYPLPFFVSLFDPKTSVKLPPLDPERSPRDTVTEILHASTSKEHGVVFRFAIEVGTKRSQREEFEWRKTEGGKEEGAHGTGSQYTLHRPSSNPAAPSSSSSPPLDDTQTVAELTFRNVMNLKHAFTLELKGAGRTGELGDRWALMVVMTSLGLHWLRQNGRTKKATVGAAQKIHSK